MEAKKNNMAPAADNMTDLQKDIFAKINNNEAAELKVLLAANRSKVDFVDENGMSPLQHASYKGNKEIVQMLLDQVRFVLLFTLRTRIVVATSSNKHELSDRL